MSYIDELQPRYKLRIAAGLGCLDNGAGSALEEACREVDRLRLALSASQDEAEKAKGGKLEITASIGVHPDSDYHDLANRFLGMKHGRQDDRIALEASESRCAALAKECEELRKDKERLDWLDGQKIEGVTMAQPRWCWRVRSGPSVSETGEQHSSIRAAIDAARATPTGGAGENAGARREET